MGWKDSVNVHTYPKYLLNKSLSTTCVLCSRERRMTCICRWVHCAKQQWYGSLSQLFWSVHSCHMNILEIRQQQSSEAIAMTCVFPNDPCIYLKLNRFYTYIVCTVNNHNGSYHFKMRLFFMFWKVICKTRTLGKCEHLLSPFNPKIIRQIHPKTANYILMILSLKLVCFLI